MRPVPPELVEEVTALLNEPVPEHKDVRVQELRRHMRRAYLPWSEREDALLLALSKAGYSVAELSDLLCRQPGAIQSRLIKHLGVSAPLESPPPSAPPQVTRVPVHLVAPHFEAWLALVRSGSRVEVLDGNEVVAVLQAPGEQRPQRRFERSRGHGDAPNG
ncbi:hypothetical protein [Deinococcus aestuarii]|uniref:hypothetical protein n=1 Tax=Deinococcus aestuarii TaxID=2774531 RepID=UPI001C0B7FF2|nr:hypothetical protein [Deinococcus aestuarii]